MAVGLELELRPEGARQILSVRGEVDMDTSPKLLNAIERELEAGRALRVDLSRVGYCDSSGVATLVRGVQLAQQRKVAFELLDVSSPVRSVLELASLLEFFSLISSGDPES